MRDTLDTPDFEKGVVEVDPSDENEEGNELHFILMIMMMTKTAVTRSQ